MNDYGQYETDRRVLRGILSLLLALADLAQFAAGRPQAVRQLVFIVLVPAESVARDFLSGIEWEFPELISGESDSCVGLMRLASSFRALACQLASLLEAGLATNAICPPNLTGALDLLFEPSRQCAASVLLPPDTS